MAYSDVEVAEALIRLAVNKYDFDKTSKETGYPPQTLRRWNKSVPKKGVGDLLERAIERMLIHIPSDWTGSNWAIAIGILMDKWLLLQGEPTSRTETIGREVAALTPSERDELIARTEAVLSRIKGAPVSAGSGGTAVP